MGPEQSAGKTAEKQPQNIQNRWFSDVLAGFQLFFGCFPGTSLGKGGSRVGWEWWQIPKLDIVVHKYRYVRNMT